MYQYALPWFSALFCKTIGQTPPAPDLEGRLKNLNDCFTAAVYANVCRSLFEAHKLLFSFLLAIKILQASIYVSRMLGVGGVVGVEGSIYCRIDYTSCVDSIWMPSLESVDVIQISQ